MDRGGYGNYRGGRRGGDYGGGYGRGRGRGRTYHHQPPQERWQTRQTSTHPNTPTPNTPIPTPSHASSSSQLASLNLLDNVEISPIRRPDNGGVMLRQQCLLRVNHYPITFNPKTVILHYNLDVKPKMPAKQGRTQKISKTELSLIRDELFMSHVPGNVLNRIGYDGEKSIFSAVELPQETFVVNISKGEDDKVTPFEVTITLVNKLELCKLRDYLSGNVLSIPRDILQGMDLVFKENPARSTVSIGRSYFPMNPPLVQRELQRGIVAIGGFQHSLKPTSQGLSLCLDYSVLSFRKKLSVLDFLHEHIRGFNLREFPRFRGQVERVLVGVKVNVTHRRTKQKYTIARLTEKASRLTTFPILDANGTTTDFNLLAYFREKYGVDVRYKDIPALAFGSKMNYVPMELCVLAEGQRYPKEYLDKYTAKTLKDMSLCRPRDREANIREMINSKEGPLGGGIIQNFGMNVKTSMTTVTGRVIAPPLLKLGDPRGNFSSLSPDPEKCQWNLVGRSMVEGKPVKYWGILDFTFHEADEDRLDAGKFISNLISKYKKLGIVMEKPIGYERSAMEKLGNYNSLCQLLENINDKVQRNYRCGLQFLLCVMTRKDPGYKCLKWISETKVGMVTQCCLSGNANDGKDQYLTNLALKINAKIGGSNVELMNRLPRFEGEGHVMFIGADVNHPASHDTNSPSIAAVVATVNWPAANRYAARVCAQDHRVEKIVNFGRICFELVECYERLNKVKPEKIVIFRDGVSESQFLMVLGEELQDLKRVFNDSHYFPTITLIVAQKRHQTRLFPASGSEGTPSGNVFPGTVVDTKIVHPFEFDFYLCSHYGSLGTSKPTHYHVLWDEHKFTSDELQKLIYDMCFTFARCTKPVSLVPPVYYADLVAYRGRLYHEARIGVQSPGSATSSSSSHMASLSLSSTSSYSNDPDCYKLHAEVENIMFFI